MDYFLEKKKGNEDLLLFTSALQITKVEFSMSGNQWSLKETFVTNLRFPNALAMNASVSHITQILFNSLLVTQTWAVFEITHLKVYSVCSECSINESK